MEWFQTLLNDRIGVLEEDLALRLTGSQADARAWFESQAKEILAMAAVWGCASRTAVRLDDFRRRLGWSAGVLPLPIDVPP